MRESATRGAGAKRLSRRRNHSYNRKGNLKMNKWGGGLDKGNKRERLSPATTAINVKGK